MGDIVVRKCDICDGVLEINVHDIRDVALRSGKYYHTSCLLEYAKNKVEVKRGRWQTWQDVVDNIAEYENNAKNTLKNSFYRDELNKYLISMYNVITPPSRLFQVVADLNNGTYKRKQCNPINTCDLLDAWKWGQHNLDKINKTNKMKGIGPKTEDERILYDLAVIIGKIPVFLEKREQQRAAEINRQRDLAEAVKIDYNKVVSNKVQNNSLQDISSLVDDIF